MNPKDQLHNQRIKEKALNIITTTTAAAAVITSTGDASPGIVVTLLGVVVIQWIRAERAARRIRELDGKET